MEEKILTYVAIILLVLFICFEPFMLITNYLITKRSK